MKEDLHSTIFRFRQKGVPARLYLGQHLHSTIFRFRPFINENQGDFTAIYIPLFLDLDFAENQFLCPT